MNWAKGTQEAKVSYLPRHAQPALGDTVYTSGYGGIYQPNLPIGIVTDAKLGASDSFYHVLIRVLTDFYALHYVYVLKWPLQHEYDSLQFRMDLANNRESTRLYFFYAALYARFWRATTTCRHPRSGRVSDGLPLCAAFTVFANVCFSRVATYCGFCDRIVGGYNVRYSRRAYGRYCGYDIC